MSSSHGGGQGGGGVNKTNSGGGCEETRDAPDAVHSLGEALAGVTIGQAPHTAVSTPSATVSMGLTGGVPSSASNAFSLAPGGLSSASSSGQPDNDAWGNFHHAAVTTNGTGHHPSINVAVSTGGQPKTALDNTNTQRPGGGTHSEGLELFLSQSPSRSLGHNVFKLSHTNLPALVNNVNAVNTVNNNNEEDRAPQSDPSAAFRYTGHHSLSAPRSGTAGVAAFGEIRPAGNDNRSRRTDSPSCSATGTTTSSRSVSPYTQHSNAADNGRTIGAYHQLYDPSSSSNNNNKDLLARQHASFAEAEEERTSPGYHHSMSHGHASHPSLPTLESVHRSPYAKNQNNNNNPQSNIFRASASPHDHTMQEQRSFIPHPELASPQHLHPPHQQQQPPQPGSNAAAPNAQVLYMAVPSPDGRGQVLQPVQMVQLPGKPYHFVGSIAGQSSEPSAPQMMVLPPLPNQNGIEYQSPMAPSAAAAAAENRNRVANYALEGSSSRQYSMDNSSPPSSRDEFSVSRAGSVTSPFPIDAAVASLYAAPQRPPLDALLGQVRRLSRDQVGCRLVQQALDEEGPMAATLILNEGLPFWGEAMVDPFGNYLFQKILEKVTSEERVMLVKTVSPRLVNASLNLHGTRSVQKLVELCSQDEQNGYAGGGGNGEESAADILTAALSPAAARLCIDSHGNHVIQRILLKLGPKHSKFVFDAVAASVGDVARHRHGCCVIQRCLDSPPTEARAHLVRRIVDKSLELMQDAYGNYVVQYVLDVCSDEDVHAVCESVVGKVNLLAIQKFSSNVMEKCLERCGDRIKEHYLAEMSDAERIRELMMDPFGNYVVQRALSVATHTQAVRLVESMRPHLIATQTTTTSVGPHGGQSQHVHRNGGVRNTAGGRRIIAKICRRFPNFTLSGTISQEELYSSNKGGGNSGVSHNHRLVAVGGGGGGGHHHHHHHHHPQQASPGGGTGGPLLPHQGLGGMGMGFGPPQGGGGLQSHHHGGGGGGLMSPYAPVGGPPMGTPPPMQQNPYNNMGDLRGMSPHGNGHNHGGHNHGGHNHGHGHGHGHGLGLGGHGLGLGGQIPMQQQQQQSFYTTAGSPFYEHQFNNGGGRGGYSGM